MFRYIMRRMMETIPVLIGVSLLVFFSIHLIPGDPASVMLGERATEENIARVRESLGLNSPLLINLPGSVPGQPWSLLYIRQSDTLEAVRIIDPGTPDERTEEPDLRTALRLIGVRDVTDLELEPNAPQTFETYNGSITIAQKTESVLYSDFFDSQYFIFVGRILRGDLGSSIQGNISIRSELERRFPATVELAVTAILLAVLVGVPLGIISAVRRDSWIDTASMFGALIGVSFPVYVLGLIGIYVFSVQLGWFPTGRRLATEITLDPITGLNVIDSMLRGNTEALFNTLHHLILPAIVLSTVPLAIIARITRSTMLEVLHQDYIRTARSKGLHERLVVVRHALRNAMLPVVTVIGLTMGGLLSGAVLTETIFTWPGIGKWLLDAINGRDYPIVQAVTLIVALIYVTVNLIVDLSYAVFDPRIRYR